jgi:hypothetical protein
MSSVVSTPVGFWSGLAFGLRLTSQVGGLDLESVASAYFGVLRALCYLDLERTMLALEDAGDPMADTLRDALDPIWYALTDDDRVFLNRRDIASGPVYYARKLDILRLKMCLVRFQNDLGIRIR